MDNIDFYRRSAFRRPQPPPARTPFRIRVAGGGGPSPRHLSYGTYHEDATLTYIAEGLGRFREMDRSRPLGKGSLLLVLPEDPQSILMADAEQPYHHYYCRFSGAEALRMARHIRAGQRDPLRVWDDDVALLGIWRRIIAEHRLGADHDEFMSPAEAQLASLLALLMQSPSRQQARPKLDRERLSSYLFEHLHVPVSIPEVAAAFQVSDAHFCRRARELLGESYHQAATREKMELARRLLLTNRESLSIAEIADRLGYADPLYFSKVFRRHFQRSPRQFREEQES